MSKMKSLLQLNCKWDIVHNHENGYMLSYVNFAQGYPIESISFQKVADVGVLKMTTWFDGRPNELHREVIKDAKQVADAIAKQNIYLQQQGFKMIPGYIAEGICQRFGLKEPKVAQTIFYNVPTITILKPNGKQMSKSEQIKQSREHEALKPLHKSHR
jgi:hypothetical protein